MDTITTIPSLLTCIGSAQPVTVALTPSDIRLISAAPELLEALESALATATFEQHPHRAWHDQAHAAIAKATGEQP